MKRSVAIAIGTAFLSAAVTPFAQETKAPASTPSGAVTQPTPSRNAGSLMGQMDEHIKTMQGLHNRMASAATPEERQKVMDEQRTEMQGSMGMMNEMMRDGAMMGAMGPGMMGQQGKPADAGAQIQMMHKRMDMMQMMMQTMMDQQGLMAGPRGMGTAPTK